MGHCCCYPSPAVGIAAADDDVVVVVVGGGAGGGLDFGRGGAVACFGKGRAGRTGGGMTKGAERSRGLGKPWAG